MLNWRLLQDLIARVAGSTRGRRVIRNLSVGVGGSGFAMVLALATTALVTRTISIDDFGRVMIVLDLFAFILMFLDLRVQDVLFRYFPDWRREAPRERVRALLVVSLTASAGLGIVVLAGAVSASPWIARAWYDDPSLAPLIRIYAIASMAAAFTGFSTAILRIHDRFSAVVVPQVIGWMVTLGFLLVYLLVLDGRELRVVIGGYAVGAFIRSAVPLVLSLNQVREWWGRRPGERSLWAALAGQKRALSGMFLQTNLTGYLKLGSDRGGAFLLGLLSSPAQVAIFGLARQLTAPLVMLQGNVQASVAPEIFELRAGKNYASLQRMIGLLTRSQVLTSLGLLLVAALGARPAILAVSGSQYLAAVPVFLVLFVAGLVNYSAVAFYPLAVALEKLKRRNLMASLRFVYLGIAALMGMTALTLSVVQLAGNVTTRVGADWPLSEDLSSLAAADR